MVIIAWIVSFAAGLLQWPWWVIVITSVAAIIGTNAASGGRVERMNMSHPIMLVWASLPQFALWGIGLWIGGFFR